MSRDPIIEIVDLDRYFKNGHKKHYALKSINLKISRGEFVVLKGVSGSGKTTLLSIMAGLDRPSKGGVTVEGELLPKLPDAHLSRFRGRHIGMIFQHYNLIETLTVRENVLTPLVPMGIDAYEARKRTEASMDRANILHKADLQVRYLSGGEKQRAAIARAIVSEPEIILCDEPTANLDRENSLKFLDILIEINKGGKTIVVATHDPIFEELDIPRTSIEMEDGIIV